ncbi:hypothetical protein WM40_18260 [Robbsia andropogonis]|uniref:Uncharacterized protein n=1 Tax=Robbsia andropogonis TaxID=28092 RepID=A0A0F5JWM0_9BURK|nr:hypothetical protein [Robbsia andropogonis]KKB62253.1 hypothetical protein WM40_18260 [Robbsia andropogonis]
MTHIPLAPGGAVADLQAGWEAVTDVRPFAEAERQSNLIEHGFSPLWRGVVRLLSSLPIIGNTNPVKQAAADITFSDTARAERFEAFVGALRSQYSAEITDEVVALTALSPANYLSLSKMREARDVALMRECLTHNQQFTNRIEVKVWNWENMRRVGHVALLMRHELTDGGDTKLTGPDAETYASWWPGGDFDASPDEGQVSGLEAKISDRLEFDIQTQRGFAGSYTSDMYSEMSQRAREGLESGRFAPLPGQVPINIYQGGEDEAPNVSWGKEPDASIAMPMAGYNERPHPGGTGTDANGVVVPTLTTFGLSVDAIKTYWETEAIGNDAAQFKLVSTDRNCSGMAARLLKAGGAHAFLPVPEAVLFLDPNTMRRYTTDLMTEVTALNAKADTVDASFGRLFTEDEGADESGVTPSYSVRLARAQEAIASLPRATQASMQALNNALNECKTEAGDYEGMMRQMKAMVGGLHNHVNGPFGSDINKALRSAYELYSAIRGAAHEAGYLREASDSDIPSDFFDN